MLHIGNAIAELRESREITQEDLAKTLGIARSTLSHYEKNRRKPPLDIIVLLANTFNITVEQIINFHKREI
ncbi:helix-turn-helix transcriptional regulator [Paenibacillus taihuensis]|uniref:helix-turn-helix transcriptional regulator n=1 Tax=Paenibacillus taihuensis TaxID=1156355 RepID=UPI0015F2901F|nr:helix-turn-helix transcriptional regulator [Paenibacillus taihuensis]